MAINFACFNCNWFKRFEPHVDRLLCDYDIICLQETMLTKQECATIVYVMIDMDMVYPLLMLHYESLENAQIAVLVSYERNIENLMYQ